MINEKRGIGQITKENIQNNDDKKEEPDGGWGNQVELSGQAKENQDASCPFPWRWKLKQKQRRERKICGSGSGEKEKRRCGEWRRNRNCND